MALTDRVTELKKQGLPDAEIETRLRNEGVSPMEISDAMNQSKIKEAVSGEEKVSTKGMVPSIMGNQDEEEEAQEGEDEEAPYKPSPAPKQKRNSYEDYSSQQNYSDPQQNYTSSGKNYPDPYAQYYQNSQNSEPEYYEENPGETQYADESYQDSGYGSSDTMIEVAEQVFSEKVKKIEDDLRTLKEFKTLSSPKLDDVDERLRRIEKNFDKLQLAILDKVGSFGRSIESVKKEIEMVEDSVEKMNKNKR